MRVSRGYNTYNHWGIQVEIQRGMQGEFMEATGNEGTDMEYLSVLKIMQREVMHRELETPMEK